MKENCTVLLPLYIYPFEGAWDPLYDAIATFPSQKFTVVVNPYNGPGLTPLPDANYLREIPRLNALPNVTTVGYIRVDYAKRPLRDVLDDVTHYASWAREGNGELAMHGVFVDETPNAFKKEMKEYLDRLTKHVKSIDGILGDRFVIHNPGCVPDARYARSGPDMTVVAEQTCAQYDSELVQGLLEDSPFTREQTGLVLHSVPARRIEEIVGRAREHAGHVFVTELMRNYYESFGLTWKRFIKLLQ